MSLGAVIDSLGTFLLDAVTPRPAMAGGTAPGAADELPALTLSFEDATRILIGVGRIPRPPRTGALRVTRSINLEDPVLRHPGEPDIALLSVDRTTLQLPHAPLVTADGSDIVPLTADDLEVTLGGTTFTVVNAPPTGTEVRPNAASGILTFGTPLPATGVLQLGYFIGQWTVHSARYQGTLTVDVYAESSADAHTLSQSVDRALLGEPPGSPPGLRKISPLSWGSVVAAVAPIADARRRTLRYRIDVETEEVVVPTTGGLITRVRVAGDVDGQSEVFDVTS
jgi:hypothetical protein